MTAAQPARAPARALPQRATRSITMARGPGARPDQIGMAGATGRVASRPGGEARGRRVASASPPMLMVLARVWQYYLLHALPPSGSVSPRSEHINAPLGDSSAPSAGMSLSQAAHDAICLAPSLWRFALLCHRMQVSAQPLCRESIVVALI